MRLDARYEQETDTLTLSVEHVPDEATTLSSPRGLRLTVNDDATELYRVEIPYFHNRVDFVDLYYLLGPDGVHQVALLQDDLTTQNAHVTAPDDPLRRGSKARKLLTA